MKEETELHNKSQEKKFSKFKKDNYFICRVCWSDERNCNILAMGVSDIFRIESDLPEDYTEEYAIQLRDKLFGETIEAIFPEYKIK